MYIGVVQGIIGEFRYMSLVQKYEGFLLPFEWHEADGRHLIMHVKRNDGDSCFE